MKQCHFCTNNLKEIDYKDIEALKLFIDGHGRITKHKKSSTCSRHQRDLSNAIKRARLMALIPFIQG